VQLILKNMILELYLFLQAVTFLLLAMIFITKTPLASVLTMITSAMLMVGAWMLRVGTEYVWDSSIRAYVTQPIYVQTGYLPFVNMAVFSIALLFFIYDMFLVAEEELTSHEGGLGVK